MAVDYVLEDLMAKLAMNISEPNSHKQENESLDKADKYLVGGEFFLFSKMLSTAGIELFMKYN
ncbi:unnamed protein product [Ceratitis capitata]|uniref:(Mediterranean fruit fly) hypothetical protein n=1 Tax=Ceratitis capitata TaxID=7213 RepID=A0A811UEG3_CERCA|nr:unnamed protein product [Ceratitis capitata]